MNAQTYATQRKETLATLIALRSVKDSDTFIRIRDTVLHGARNARIARMGYRDYESGYSLSDSTVRCRRYVRSLPRNVTSQQYDRLYQRLVDFWIDGMFAASRAAKASGTWTPRKR